jgi:hypothetical protein
MVQFTSEYVRGTHINVNKKKYPSSSSDDWNLDGGIVPPVAHPSETYHGCIRTLTQSWREIVWCVHERYYFLFLICQCDVLPVLIA